MKFYYTSDIHINHWVKFNTNQGKWDKNTRKFVNNKLVTIDSKDSVIIIAGDFSEYNNQTKWVLDELSKHYKYVLCVTGNHDLYLVSKSQKKKYSNNSINRIKELKEWSKDYNNVFILQNEKIELEGISIAGTRLWYNPTTPEFISFFENMSNDSNYINYVIKDHLVRNTEWCSIFNYEDIEFYNQLDKVDLMITHIPPIHPKFSNEKYNECYTTKVDELKANVWVCGHQHIKGIEQINDTTFYMNPVGYPNELALSDFQLESFEIN